MSRTELIRVTADPKPSIWSRMVEVVRSYTTGPLTSRSPEVAKYFGGGGSSMAGVNVTEHSAMTLSAVFSAVSRISNDVAVLPLRLYKQTDDQEKTPFKTHPLYRLLSRKPNPEMGTMQFRQTMQAHVLLWGNAYAEIERDQVGRPIALWPLLPESVAAFRGRANELRYRVSGPSGGTVEIPYTDMIHLTGHSHDGVSGRSIVDMARESFGLALAAEQFGATFFGNGATFGGVISFKGPKPPEMSDENYRQQLEARHQGVKRAHKLLALYNDASFTPTGVEPNSAQFLETRTFQIRDVARWFRMPPHMLADLADATFSNVEHQRLEYYSGCILHWLKKWEEELENKLISDLERNSQFIEHEIKGFLAADATTRGAFYVQMVSNGLMTINEVRYLENLNRKTGGDDLLVPSNNLTPLQLLAKQKEAEIALLEAKTSQAENPAPAAPPKANEPDPAMEQMSAKIDGLEQRIFDDMLKTRTIATDFDRRLTVALDEAKALEAERDAAQEAVTAAARALSEAEAAHRAAQAETVERTAEQIAALERDWIAERNRLQQARDAAQAEKSDLDVLLGAAERERDKARADSDAAVKRAAEVVDDAKRFYAEAESARAAYVTEQAIVDELRAQVAAHQAQADSLTRAALEAEAAKALAEARAAERDAAAVFERAERVAIETRQASTVDRLGALSLAHRALFVDAIARLLQREGDRARKAQASPEKLRAWVDTFYQLHGETCRSVLRPVVLAWAPCVGLNADAVLADLVQEHLDTSRRDLRLAADTEDADELAANLARVLYRWETERADAVADRLLAEGERHGH